MNEESKLKKLREKINSRGAKKKIDTFFSLKKKQEKEIKKKWEGEEDILNDFKEPQLFRYEKRGLNMFFVAFIFSIVFFVIAGTFAFFYIFYNQTSEQKELHMKIIAPDSVKSGADFRYQIKLDNETDIDYTKVGLVIEYPKSTINPLNNKIIKTEEFDFDKDLRAGGVLSKRFNVLLSGSKGEEKEIKIKLYYTPKGYDNILVKRKKYKVIISDSSINLNMKIPDELLSGEMNDFIINVKSNSDSILENILVIVNYPLSFEFVSSEPESIFSQSSKNIFKIDKLKPNEQKEIKIKGKIFGQNEENKFFILQAGDTYEHKDEMKTLLAKAEKKIVIKRPDLDFIVTSSKKDDEIGGIIGFPGKIIPFHIKLRNNLSSLLSDIKIKVYTKSLLFKKKQVDVKKGFFNSNTSTILWDKSTDDQLQVLSGKSSVNEYFSLELKDFKDLAGYYKDMNIKLEFEVSGTNFDSKSSNGRVVKKIVKNIKIPTRVDFASNIYYAKGPFENTGGPKPEAGKEITYTVEWSVYNSNSDIKDVKISTQLPIYVNFKNVISPKNYYVTYNPNSRKVEWTVKNIQAFTGYRTPPEKVYFQIGFIPSATQIGTEPVLLKTKFFEAKDTFIEDRKIELELPANTTNLEGDLNYSYNNKYVGGQVDDDSKQEVDENGNVKDEDGDEEKEV